MGAGLFRPDVARPPRASCKPPVSDLELAVIDGLGDQTLEPRERGALKALRVQLKTCRSDRALRFHIRSIIVVERVSGESRRQESAAGGG